MNAIQIFRTEDEVPYETVASIIALVSQVWPPADGKQPTVEEVIARCKGRGSLIIVMQEKGAVIAHAQIFRREIKTEHGTLPIGALAGVCVHPDQRGHGYGAEVVRHAFQVLPELGVEVSLYQTDVPEFYEKLGARRVTNQFFDGTRTDGGRENPFWGAYEMIYPASFSWPEGEIDLNGPGY
jgi:predicted N-acetyltransferase YhbS